MDCQNDHLPEATVAWASNFDNNLVFNINVAMAEFIEPIYQHDGATFLRDHDAPASTNTQVVPQKVASGVAPMSEQDRDVPANTHDLANTSLILEPLPFDSIVAGICEDCNTRFGPTDSGHFSYCVNCRHLHPPLSEASEHLSFLGQPESVRQTSEAVPLGGPMTPFTPVGQHQPGPIPTWLSEQYPFDGRPHSRSETPQMVSPVTIATYGSSPGKHQTTPIQAQRPELPRFGGQANLMPERAQAVPPIAAQTLDTPLGFNQPGPLLPARGPRVLPRPPYFTPLPPGTLRPLPTGPGITPPRPGEHAYRIAQEAAARNSLCGRGNSYHPNPRPARQSATRVPNEYAPPPAEAQLLPDLYDRVGQRQQAQNGLSRSQPSPENPQPIRQQPQHNAPRLQSTPDNGQLTPRNLGSPFHQPHVNLPNPFAPPPPRNPHGLRQIPMIVQPLPRPDGSSPPRALANPSGRVKCGICSRQFPPNDHNNGQNCTQCCNAKAYGGVDLWAETGMEMTVVGRRKWNEGVAARARERR